MTFRTLIVLFFLAFSAAESIGAEPVKIGLTLGLSGKYAEMSKNQMNGYRLWEKQVNSRGGLLGREVKIIIYDDKSDTRIAKDLYEKLILTDKVDLLFGPYSSEIADAVFPVTEKYRYPVVSSGASSDSLFEKGYRYVFGTHTPASKIITGFLELLSLNGLNNIAIIHADDPFSIKVAESTGKWAERFGLNMVSSEGFRKGREDLDEFVLKAKESGAQGLIICGHLDEAVNMRLALKRLNWFPKAYFATVGPTVTAFYDRLGKEAEHVFSSTNWEPNARFPGSDEFYKAFIKAYKYMPNQQAAVAYAGGEVLEAAVKKAGSLDREKIRDSLAAMDAISIIGRYGVERTGLQLKHFNFIIQWQNGKKEIVWPEELRTAKPIFK